MLPHQIPENPYHPQLSKKEIKREVALTTFLCYESPISMTYERTGTTSNRTKKRQKDYAQHFKWQTIVTTYKNIRDTRSKP